ncbi:hypothetical protein GCM10010321_80010 [Streptomyces chartreusis]|nr:hypothetical protein GCM10010321_80010 [Streptomyces chartreusis]
MTTAPTTAVAAAAAAKPRNAMVWENTQGASAQTTDTPAMADGGSILCKGGEWR